MPYEKKNLYDEDTKTYYNAKGIEQKEDVNNDEVFVDTYKTQKVSLPAKVYVIKLILRPQPLEFDNEYEKGIDEEYMRKNTKFVRIFPCKGYNCKSERYLESSILQSENKNFKTIRAIILSPNTEVELIPLSKKNRSRIYFNDDENASKQIEVTNNDYIELKLREYVRAQPPVSSMSYSNYESEEKRDNNNDKDPTFTQNNDPSSHSFLETDNNDNDAADTISYPPVPIYNSASINDQSQFDNNSNNVNDNDNKNENEIKEEKVQDFSLFSVIMSLIGIVILIVITVRVLKKKRIEM